MVDFHIEVKGANVVNVDEDDEKGRRAEEGAGNTTKCYKKPHASFNVGLV
jgi:hypothetical protein